MILRLTHKLASRLHVRLSRSLPLDKNPFADWTGHLFTADRTQYIIVANTASLYSLVMLGRGITTSDHLLHWLVHRLSDYMMHDGLEFLFQRLVVPHMTSTEFSKTGDRRVMGSINDLVAQAKFFLVEHRVSPVEVSDRLNKTPMSMLHYGNPREAFKALQIGQN